MGMNLMIRRWEGRVACTGDIINEYRVLEKLKG
jgi:hypothetical protein